MTHYVHELRADCWLPRAECKGGSPQAERPFYEDCVILRPQGQDRALVTSDPKLPITMPDG